MARKIEAENPQVRQLEELIKAELDVPATAVVPTAGELLGMATSAYYQIRRAAKPPGAGVQILLHLLLNVIPPKKLADVLRDVRALKNAESEEAAAVAS